MSAAELAARVKQRARALGFDSAGITDLSPTPHGDALSRWLERGMAGTMRYMHRQAAHRRAPAFILRGAARAVVVTRNYYQPDPPPGAARGRVAKYARGRDYHTALRGPLDRLARYLIELGPAGTIARGYVDAGPVPERELAQRAGLGWIGKNTMLIDPARGSFLFLAAVLTSLELAVDLPFEADRCGTCRRCLDACPTGALPEPRVLDSRRCISYLTIEHRGGWSDEERARTGDWVFGCDICQDVCPWNVRFAAPPGDDLLQPDPSLASLDLKTVERLTEDAFETRYGHTALERAGAAGLRRNAAAARGNADREAPSSVR